VADHAVAGHHQGLAGAHSATSSLRARIRSAQRLLLPGALPSC
jgi:hypothetical protein